MPNPTKLSEDEIAIKLKTVALHFIDEDKGTREILIRRWKRLKYYWNNFSQVYWSEQDNAYRIWGTDFANPTSGSEDQGYYDRPVNVFRAFLETIVAALSINIPAVSCSPKDADNPLDIETAKAGNIISQQIYKLNNVILIWLQALYIYCTEGMIACYTYPMEDEEYGTYKVPTYKKQEIEAHRCPGCGNEISDEEVMMAQLSAPQVEEGIGAPIQLDEPANCLSCNTPINPASVKEKFKIPVFDQFKDEIKERVCIEVYGGLYVKTALYAKKASDTYAALMYETHYVNALRDYPDLLNEFPDGKWSNQGTPNTYEQYARLNIQYRGTAPEENVTIKEVWLRPQHFYILPKADYELLLEKFPKGAKVTIVNDLVAEYKEENLDDRWTFTFNPMSDYLTHEPMGELLVNIQDIINDLISLTLQLIEHGVPQTFVDPGVIDTDAQGQLEVLPGALTPTKPLGSGKRVSDAFFSTSTSAVSPEIFNFYNIVQQLGQFVSGALPSLFGGVQQGQGETATEYTTARAMALQRLQTPWKMMTIWWKQVMFKVINQQIELIVDDETIVDKDNNGNFINVFIKKAELSGRIGGIELEASDQLPVSDEQMKQIIMELMSLNNQEIFSALITPENIPWIRKIVRIPQFKLPGEDDRQKQYEEINQLVNSVPIPLPPDMNMMLTAKLSGQPEPEPMEIPSVEIDPIVDNHQIEAEICRTWLVSEAGRFAKTENPLGYKNVLLHMKMHIDEMNKAMQMANMQQSAINKDLQKTSGKRTPAKKSETVGAE